MGRWETPLLGLLTLLPCCLPFIHPRYGPVGLVCGALVLLHAWRSQRRLPALFLVGLIVTTSLSTVFAFHYAFSDDWLGPLRPGSGPWGEDPLDIATWSISIPGHWLQVRDGILNTSPIYFFALFGLVTLARFRDRRVVIAIVLYAATACIYGLHGVWNLGHGFPGRFMMTGMPVLAIGLAWGLPMVWRRPTTSFLVAIALAISLESVIHTALLPEMGYNGKNLLGRSINRFYPLHIHFFEQDQQVLPLLDLIFWGLLAERCSSAPGMLGSAPPSSQWWPSRRSCGVRPMRRPPASKQAGRPICPPLGQNRTISTGVRRSARTCG